MKLTIYNPTKNSALGKYGKEEKLMITEVEEDSIIWHGKTMAEDEAQSFGDNGEKIFIKKNKNDKNAFLVETAGGMNCPLADYDEEAGYFWQFKIIVPREDDEEEEIQLGYVNLMQGYDESGHIGKDIYYVDWTN